MVTQEKTEIFEISSIVAQTVKSLESTQCSCYFDKNIIFPYKKSYVISCKTVKVLHTVRTISFPEDDLHPARRGHLCDRQRYCKCAEASGTCLFYWCSEYTKNRGTINKITKASLVKCWKIICIVDQTAL